MPEGPSILILKEALQPFVGKKILEAGGNAKVDVASLKGATLAGLRSWGKQFFLFTTKQTIRIHFLMWGSYSINEQTKPDKSVRLKLRFKNGTVFFNTCSVKFVEVDMIQLYDWKADVLSDEWDAKNARKKLKAQPELMACDALLDQQIFAGVGNIIKNEVLYRIRLHPETLIKNIPPRKLTELITEARNYSFDFLKWKKEFVLRKHWLVHTKKTCMRCHLPLIKKHCGKTNRRSFFCEGCQVKYGD